MQDTSSSNNADAAFGDLLRSNVQKLLKRLKLCCQNEIYRVFKCMMAATAEDNGNPIAQGNANIDPGELVYTDKNIYLSCKGSSTYDVSIKGEGQI